MKNTDEDDGFIYENIQEISQQVLIEKRIFITEFWFESWFFNFTKKTVRKFKKWVTK